MLPSLTHSLTHSLILMTYEVLPPIGDSSHKNKRKIIPTNFTTLSFPGRWRGALQRIIINHVIIHYRFMLVYVKEYHTKTAKKKKKNIKSIIRKSSKLLIWKSFSYVYNHHSLLRRFIWIQHNNQLLVDLLIERCAGITEVMNIFQDLFQPLVQ